MKKRNVKRTNRRKNTRPPLAWRGILVTTFCFCVLFAGFFFAASHHFSSMDLGMRNSELRNQLDELQAENRRLLLAKETAMSPGRIRDVAKNIGFADSNISASPVIITAKTPVEPERNDQTTEVASAPETDAKVATAKNSPAGSETRKSGDERLRIERISPDAKIVRTTMAVRTVVGEKPRERSKKSENDDTKPLKPAKNIDERPRLASVAKTR